MFKIYPDNKIKLTKGDTATIRVSIKDNDGNVYSIKDGDEIKMTVKKSPSDSSPLFSLLANKDVIIINPSNTSAKDTGVYIYDIQLNTTEGNVYTIVQGYFELLEEVS